MSEHGLIKGGSFLVQKTAPAQVATPEDMTEEHRMILQTSWDFVEKEIQPVMARIEKKEAGLSQKLMAKAGELGLNGTDVPEAYGGLGLDKVSTAVVTEAIGATGSFATTHGAHTGIGTLPIVFFGTEEQKKKYLPGLASGERIGAYALTEPGAGSDAMGGCKTKAVLSADGKHYILNGQKIFITNAAWAETFIAYAKVDGEKFTAFIVERGYPGVSVGPEESKLGIHGSSTASVIFEDAKVPVENVLHEIGKGHQVAFNILNVGRYKLGAATVGACKVLTKAAAQYAKVREQFGHPIASFGAIKEKLANMAILTYLNESIAHRTAGLLESVLETIPASDPQYGRKAMEAIREYAVECSIDKVFGSEAVGYIVDEAIQVHGGYGYIDEYPVERAYRDARILRIYEGTNEINRMIVLSEIMGRAMKGQLPVFDMAAQVSAEATKPAAGPAEIPAGPLGPQEFMIGQMKKAAVFAASAAVNRFAMELTHEQEVVSRISDMISQIFVAETGLLRAQKMLEAKGEDAAKYAVAMVRAYVDDLMPKMDLWARSALTHISQGDALETNLMAIRRFLRPIHADAISLKRMIADRVIELGAYPL
jgi:alkylation response protein AidB-like acyl-CoA dehydrogenase